MSGEGVREQHDIVAVAIKRLQLFAPEEGYYLAFSGGKDSVVIKRLADMAGVKYDAHYSVTTIDPPELIHFIRMWHSDVRWEHPKRPFLAEMAERGFPMRMNRWCCADYKEKGGRDRFVITGIRWAESARRKNTRQMTEFCPTQGKRLLHPIIDWSDGDVWQFIRENKIPYCKLYDEGFDRIGCLLCPLARKAARRREAERYPRYVEMFRRAFRKIYANKKARGFTSVDRWHDGDEMFDWWMK